MILILLLRSDYDAGIQHFARWLTAALAKLGQLDEARAAGARLLTLDPGFTINRWCSAVGFAPHVKNVMADGLKLAGLPE